MGQAGEALARFDQAVALNPRSPVAHSGRGDALAVLGQLEQAELAYRQAVAADGSSLRARLRLARTLLCLERPDEAAACLAGPVDGQARKQVESMLELSRKMAQALQALATDPADPPGLTALVRLQLELGNGRRAVDHLRAAVARRPDSTVLLNALAWQLATWPDELVRDGGEAVELAERACRMTGNARPDYLSTLAAAYAELGRFEDAVRTVRTALDLVADSGPERDLLERRLATYQEGRPCRQERPNGPDERQR